MIAGGAVASPVLSLRDELAYVVAWELFYGQTLPDGYVIHHADGRHSHADPARLIAVPRGLHTAMAFSCPVRGAMTWSRRVRFPPAGLDKPMLNVKYPKGIPNRGAWLGQFG